MFHCFSVSSTNALERLSLYHRVFVPLCLISSTRGSFFYCSTKRRSGFYCGSVLLLKSVWSIVSVFWFFVCFFLLLCKRLFVLLCLCSSSWRFMLCWVFVPLPRPLYSAMHVSVPIQEASYSSVSLFHYSGSHVALCLFHRCRSLLDSVCSTVSVFPQGQAPCSAMSTFHYLRFLFSTAFVPRQISMFTCLFVPLLEGLCFTVLCLLFCAGLYVPVCLCSSNIGSMFCGLSLSARESMLHWQFFFQGLCVLVCLCFAASGSVFHCVLVSVLEAAFYTLFSAARGYIFHFPFAAIQGSMFHCFLLLLILDAPMFHCFLLLVAPFSLSVSCYWRLHVSLSARGSMFH